VKIISGGQTGVDRAALDVAIHLGVSHGGWCPSGRQAEDGEIDPVYQLQETATREYNRRTKWNVRDTEATLILHRGVLEGGTAYTFTCAKQLQKPCLVINLAQPPDNQKILEWLNEKNINTLNIAGPRESKQPGIYQQAYDYLESLLSNIDSATEGTEFTEK
jgi:hypothetical protein